MKKKLLNNVVSPSWMDASCFTPGDSRDVLLYDTDMNKYVGYFDHHKERWVAETYNICEVLPDELITHWMELPGDPLSTFDN